uniref:Uncharacterized protein n=1 Tax=viral metagenome TaxID=1070528 RepID=A0A6C0C363_9ZZZZ
MQHCNASSVKSLELRAAASGEVGLLGEEAAQRLLSIYGEAATCCFAQLKELSLQHGESKQDALFDVGLNLVCKWDIDIATEEASRLEIAYPEILSLHTYVFLWLMDRLCSNENLHAPVLPQLGEIYAAFMKRVAKHRDVRKGPCFLDWSELVRRSVYVDAFRCVYHDAVQKIIRRGELADVESFTRFSHHRRESHIVPDEAASQTGTVERQRFETNVDNYLDKSNSRVSSVHQNAPSALKLAIRNETTMAEEKTPAPTPRPPYLAALHAESTYPNTQAESERNDQADSESSGVAPQSVSRTSRETKAVTLPGAYFFVDADRNQNAPPI